MSLDSVEEGVGIAAVEEPPAGRRRGVSLWFLAIPIALTLAAAAVAFFLLGPRDSELLTTADQHAVALAVASTRPAPPAAPATTPANNATTGPAAP